MPALKPPELRTKKAFAPRQIADVEEARRPARRLEPGARIHPWSGTGRLRARLEAQAAIVRKGRLEAKMGSEPMTAEQRLVQRITLGVTDAEMERIRELGYEDYLEEQLDHEAIDDSAFEATLRQLFPTLEMTPAQLYEQDYEAVYEFQEASLYRAIYSKKQLYERMVIFWSDHFNIDLHKDYGPIFKPVDDREVIRRHALGYFPDLLRASAHSPAMLTYLTNDTSTKYDPNENYPRELMELHSLGVDGGYTQEDVREVSRCLTGWTFEYNHDSPNFGSFRFDDYAHDFGAKRVLGVNIPAGGGEDDGQRVIDLLAKHPSTALFISRKMARYFLGYRPSELVVAEMANRYLATGGSIQDMLRVLLRKHLVVNARPKLKRPFHFVVSALRALGVEVADAMSLIYILFDAGHEPFSWGPPNGYPDSDGYWSGGLLSRWNFNTYLAHNYLEGVPVEVPWLPAGLGVEQALNRITQRLSQGTFSSQALGALRSFLAAGSRDQEHLRRALGLSLSTPDFQMY